MKIGQVPFMRKGIGDRVFEIRGKRVLKGIFLSLLQGPERPFFIDRL
jgi:hypothetical protein